MRPKWIVSLEDGPQRVNHSAVMIRHTIYLFGGFCTGETSVDEKQIDVYAFNTDMLHWTKVNLRGQNFMEVPYMRYGHSSVAVDEKAYLFGGRNDTYGPCNTLFYFDPEKLCWFKPPVTGNIPGARDGHGMCVARGNIFIFGGFVSETDDFPENIFMLNMKTMIWSMLNTKGHYGLWRDFHTLTSHDDKIYLFGGQKYDGALTDPIYDNEIKVLDLNTLEWCSAACRGQILPVGRRSHSSFFHSGCLHIFGGFNSNLKQHFNDLWKFDPGSGLWTELETSGIKPCQRRRHCSCYLNGKAYIFGGTSPSLSSSCTQDLIDQSDTHVLDLEPTLKSLSMYEVVKNWSRIDTSSLPTDLEHTIKVMVRAGSSAGVRKENQG